MADPEDKHDEPVLLKRADDAIVSDTVFPELPESTLETLADFSGVIESGNSFVQEFRDASGDRFVELVEFSLGARIELNRPLWA
jgi:hypothetical protein